MIRSVSILALGVMLVGCNVNRDAGNDTTTLSVDENKVEGAVDQAGNALEGAAAEVRNAADRAAPALENAAAKAGALGARAGEAIENAAQRAGDAAERAGRAAENGAERAEADVRNETR